MTSKKETEKESGPGKPAMKRRRSPAAPPHSAAEKVNAVLALWTDRAKVAEVMRTMGVTYLTVQQWQERALEGMHQALEPRTNLANGAALPPRLRALLQRRQDNMGEDRLKARLERIEQVAEQELPGQLG